ncbi:Survival protein SurA precursor (Peptidyl-prolyl cis-trans isomerase SurA) [hydrothermal vent metagenome]|uniref:peptidylprolyl isomerase n=1 Tax=hydrothermal vent metagenome TaxID=652676 RepID=A0A3B0VZR9_9ZZZZ
MKSYQWILAILITVSTAFPIQANASNTTINNNTQNASRVIAALVNEQPIYKDQLNAKIQAKKDKYKRFNQGKQPPEDLKQRIQKNVLEEYIFAELIYQASQQHQVTDIETKINEIVALLKEKSPDAEINKTAIKRQLIVDEYLKAHDLINPQLPEKELKAFYEKNKSKFASTTTRIQVQHIVTTNKENGKEKITKAKALLSAGKPFEDVAKEYSEDANAINGGDLGTISKGYMPKEFNDVAFSIAIGEVSDIIETEFGYHILQVLAKQPAGTVPPYENMKDFLAAGFAPQVKKEKLSAHIKQLKNKAKIEVLLFSN